MSSKHFLNYIYREGVKMILDKELVLQKINEGKGYKEISQELNIGKSSLGRWLRANKVTIPRKNPVINFEPGQKIHKVEIIERTNESKNGKILWLCKCFCGKIAKIAAIDLKSERTHSCGCWSAESKRKGYEEISGSYWCSTKKQASTRKIEFDLSIEDCWNLYLNQNRKCALSGLDIKFEPKYNSQQTASIDRIDSTIGYKLSNIQWVHKDVNFIKRDLPEDKLLYYCEIITNPLPVKPVIFIEKLVNEYKEYEKITDTSNFRVDLSGKQIGAWTVLYRVKSKINGIHWLCKCKCGIEKPIVHGSLIRGMGDECIHSKSFELITGTIWNKITSDAKARNMDFEITMEDCWKIYEKQNRTCAITGLEIVFDKVRRNKTASLDRIDSSKGYFKNNIQWLHKDINMMKGSLDQKYFIELCKLIYYKPNT